MHYLFRSPGTRFLAATLLVFVAAVGGLAAQEAPAGAEDSIRLLDATLVPAPNALANTHAPSVTRLNPALGALEEDLILGGSYVGAFTSSWAQTGHSAVISAILPTRYATFATSTSFLRLNTAALNLGTTVSTHASVSKPLGPHFTAGFGLDVALGGSGSNFDVGIATSYGVFHRVPRLWSLQNFRWGLSLTGVGLPYNPVRAAGGVPAAFTPRFELATDVLNTENLRIGVDTGVSVPRFQSATLNLGVSLGLGDRVAGRLGSSIDFGAAPGAEGSAQRGYFGGSVTLTFGPSGDQETTRSRPASMTSGSRLYDSWLVGTSFRSGLGTLDSEPPQTEIPLSEPVILSPNNDGIQDRIEVPLNISDNRFLQSYRLTVEAEDGSVVRTITNPEYREETRGEESVWQRLTAVEAGIPAPDSLTWDGTTDTGEAVEDGLYAITVTATDSRGNTSTSAPLPVQIDVTEPTATLSADTAATAETIDFGGEGAGPSDDDGQRELIFSPNGDGNKDVLVISQKATAERQWDARMVNDSGETVRTWRWSGTPPEKVAWDGTDDSGTLVPDGVFTYILTATDPAGNSARASIGNIIKSVRPTPVGIAIDRSAFSPNGDGNADFLRMFVDVPTAEGAREWTVRIRSVANPQDSFIFAEGAGVPPSKLDFAGRDASGGTRIEDGRYIADLVVLYRNGNQPEASSPEFLVDTVAPETAVSATHTVFSPDGDGNRDVVTFFHEATTEEAWRAKLRTADGEVLREYSWQSSPDPTLVWDGTTVSGSLAPDGTYTYTLTGVDRAGNVGTSDPVTVRLDTGETGVVLSAGEKAFSPNADGVQDNVVLFPRVRRPESVERYTAVVRSDGEEIRRYTGTQVPSELSWDGFDANGNRVPDGTYSLDLSVRYENGSEEEASIGGIGVDTTPPSAEISAEYRLFSPNGDSRKDSLSIQQSGSSEALWEGEIVDSEGEPVRSFFWKDGLADFTWDGTDGAGNVVADGAYTYRVHAQDAAGNATARELSGLRVDTTETEVFVTVTNQAISPNGDDYRDQTSIRNYVSVVNGVERWRLEIQDESGTTVQSFTGSDVEARFDRNWSGDGEAGAVPDGVYTPVLTVWYAKGDRPSATGPEIVIDRSAPELSVDLSPVPFSPDNDGVDDELSIKLSVEDRSEIARWRFRILDRTGQYFNQFTGTSMPSGRLTWNGRAADGELVISAEDYPYEFEVTDALGNTAVTEGKIPVDILVVRDGDRLKVQIANITFAPNSAELITDQFTERGAKNRAIITRLAEVFTKYDTYDIRVEGHAVNVTGTEREEREELQPLSEARAQSVRQVLIDEGINPRRLSVAGRGGTEPVVPHTDLDNRWKNRRVEFVLVR